MVLLPILFTNIMTASLDKLEISPAVAPWLVMGIIVGGFINIPIAELKRSDEAAVHPLSIFGLDEMLPELRRSSGRMLLAVNVGGCLIPLALVVYELFRLARHDPGLLTISGEAALINVFVCFLLARPVEGLGIAIPGFVPPLVAASMALLLAPEKAPPVAFIAGVLGPLIGADLLHFKDFKKIATTGIASIGGAGTFDGIVLSGIIATYLA
jgi:uncharacterized membrane protein